jgi:short subunit dehydrogenase-like uncharacterized protein
MSRPYGVALVGATGYTGRQTVTALAQAGLRTGRWVIAGRDPAALRALAESCAPEVRPAVRTGDVRDAVAMGELAATADVVVSLTGPYGPLGDVLPAQCVAAGTDYVDLCGEDDVIAHRIAELHEPASRARVKIVPACGYESVPFDLAALALHEHFSGQDGSRLAQLDVEVVFHFRRSLLRAGNSTSGGTFATMRSFVESPTLTDPFVLADRPVPAGSRAANTVELRARRSATGDWLAPTFPTPFLNGQIVHRTNALLTNGYDPELVYREALNTTATTGSPVLGRLAAQVIAALIARIAGMSHGRRNSGDRLLLMALDRLAPRPGRGPREETLDDFDYSVTFDARSDNGRTASARLRARGNPGYRSTPKIVAAAAMALSQSGATPDTAGVLTPATALGTGFLDRLPSADITFTMG